MEHFWQYAGTIGLLASLGFGWWFGTFNWKVWFHHRNHPWLARVLFPHSARCGQLGTDFAPNLLCHTIRRAESVRQELFFTMDFEHEARARREYCIFMSLFWPVKLVWSILLFSLFRMSDLARPVA